MATLTKAAALRAARKLVGSIHSRGGNTWCFHIWNKQYDAWGDGPCNFTYRQASADRAAMIYTLALEEAFPHVDPYRWEQAGIKSRGDFDRAFDNEAANQPA